MEFRKLRADEIECRVAQVKEKQKAVILLLYKDARCDMRILDETVGGFNWQREHKEVKGVVYCGVGINAYYNEPEHEPRWVWKWDAGAESYTEKEKGESSDSYKRACFNWSIGRELYTAPFIWIEGVNLEERNGKWICKDRFVVRNIEYDNGKISFLTISNQKGKIVYSYGSSGKKSARDKLLAYCNENGIDLHTVADDYNLHKEDKPSDKDYQEALDDLKK